MGVLPIVSSTVYGGAHLGLGFCVVRSSRYTSKGVQRGGEGCDGWGDTHDPPCRGEPSNCKVQSLMVSVRTVGVVSGDGPLTVRFVVRTLPWRTTPDGDTRWASDTPSQRWVPNSQVTHRTGKLLSSAQWDVEPLETREALTFYFGVTLP